MRNSDIDKIMQNYLTEDAMRICEKFLRKSLQDLVQFMAARCL